MVSCLTLATFWTHPSSGNRILLGCFNLLVVILLILEVQTRLPMAGAQLPLVGEMLNEIFECSTVIEIEYGPHIKKEKHKVG